MISVRKAPGVGELAVDVDDRDAGRHRLLRDGRQRVALVRQDHERVGLAGDQRLDLVGLRGRVGHALGGLELDVAELLGLVAGVLGDRGHPAVVGAGRAEGDLDRALGLRRRWSRWPAWTALSPESLELVVVAATGRDAQRQRRADSATGDVA